MTAQDAEAVSKRPRRLMSLEIAWQLFRTMAFQPFATIGTGDGPDPKLTHRILG